ncbi:hypothetical protein L4C31_01810 [Aliivibrio sifiae]
MSNKLLLSLTLGVLLSGNVHSAPMLYADYLQALNAPVSSKIQDYVTQKTQPDRVINIMLSQSQKVDSDTASLFLDSVALLMVHPDYHQYLPTLRQMRIQILMLNGRIKEGIQNIENLDSKEQDRYRLLWVNSLLWTEQKELAVKVFNDVNRETYQQHKDEYINTGVDMTLNHGVLSQRFQLPEEGNNAIAQQLITTYDNMGAYDKALAERERVLMWTSDLVAQQHQRTSLVTFAKTHELIHKELLMMTTYLTIAAQKGEQFYGDVDTVHEYTNALVLYHLDPRNTERDSAWNDTLLDAEKLTGQFDSNSRRAYLKNRILLYQDTRPDFFYLDLVELATVEQDRRLLSKAYLSTLSLPIRHELLEGYFSLPVVSDEKEIVMADAYAGLIEQCEDQTPMLVRALKGHQLLQTSSILAYQCFEPIIWSSLSLSPQMQVSLQKEQEQVSYMEMKARGSESQMLSIAQGSHNSDMRLDAALFAVERQPLTASRLSELGTITEGLTLTSEQQKTVDNAIIDTLRQQGDMELLLSRLKLNPSANAMELAFGAMDQDATSEAVHYLVMRFAQPEPLSTYEEVKSVRYLDSVFSSLSLYEQGAVRSLSQDSVQTMLVLQNIESQLPGAFKENGLSTMDAVKRALTEFNQLKASLSKSVAEPNYTAQLWLTSVLNRRLAQFLVEQSTQADGRLQPILMKQSIQLKSQSDALLHQLLDLKLEGVTDVRILESVLLFEGDS